LGRAPRGVRYAWHDQELGGASPLWRLMAPTTSRWQPRRREAGWEGSRRRSRDSTNRNRVEGGATRASLPDKVKPDAIKGSFRKRGGCAMKVAGLIQGDLHGCPRCLVLRVRGVVRDGGAREGAVRCGEVSRGRSTSGDRGRWEGPNAKPRRGSLGLVGWVLKAANPCGGLDRSA